LVKPPLIPPFSNLPEEAERYRNSVRDYLAGHIKGGMPVRICMTSAAWQAVGLPVLPFSMLAVLVDKMAGLASAQKHSVTSAGVNRLPELMASPVAIFRSATRLGTYVGVLDIKDADGSPFIRAKRLVTTKPMWSKASTASQTRPGSRVRLLQDECCIWIQERLGSAAIFPGQIPS
jgi:hypothetical protein